MKHQANREFYAYWDGKRAGAAAPERSDLEPDQVRHLLGDIFVLSCDALAGYPFRVAGTRMCALLGADLKGQSFTSLFRDADRDEMADLLGIVAEETQATVVGITALAPDSTRIHLELLLLPFSARSHSPVSMTGLLAPLSPIEGPQTYGNLKDFSVTSWRHLEQDRGPRALRKWSLIRGLTVYEGLR
ncbi:MAG TPA: PAS domain-containing protein [Afipia sp.]